MVTHLNEQRSPSQESPTAQSLNSLSAPARPHEHNSSLQDTPAIPNSSATKEDVEQAKALTPLPRRTKPPRPEDYPALKWIVEPNPTANSQPISPHETVDCHLTSLDALGRLPCPDVITAKEFLQSKPSLKGKIPEREGVIQEFVERYLDGVHGVFTDALQEVIKKYSLNHKELSTAPDKLAGVRFVNKNSQVVATCFGHLLSIYSDLDEFLYHQERYLEKRMRAVYGYNIVDEKFALTDILECYTTFVGNVRKKFTHPELGTAHCTLQALASCRKGPLAMKTARAAVVEASIQMCGESTHEALPFIAPRLFCSTTGNRFYFGRDLIRTAGLDDISTPKRKSPKPSSQKTPLNLDSPEQRRHSLYRELFENLDIPVGTVFFALCALGEHRETKRNFRAFHDLIIQSQEQEKPVEGTPSTPTTSTRGAIKPFQEIIAVHQQPQKNIDLSELGRERLTDLLRQLCYRSYDGDYTKMIRELESFQTHNEEVPTTSTALANQLLKDIVPPLLARFQAVTSFQNPQGLKIVPFNYQREAAVGALFLEKPLVVLGPGTGKTETGALITEAWQYPATLWCTKADICPSTVQRLQNEILADDQRVIHLTSALLRSRPENLAATLNECRYAVVSYDTLRGLRKTLPQNFEVVKEWVSDKAKILDEGHLLDNPESERSLTLQDLPSRKTAILTATPFQHRPERAATLLHLTLPERYPDPKLLAEQFRADKSLARALLRAHATMYAISDVAKVFVPFDETSPKEQLSTGIPRIPKLVIHRHAYQLSLEHSLLYADLATNFDAWAKATKRKAGVLQQLASLRNLMTNPEMLGASPPLALLAAVKEKALPALARGEKVLIMGQRLPALSYLARDPELAKYGVALLTGKVPSQQRVATLARFEEDPTLNCVVGQIEAVGSGHNCRGITHQIFIECAKLVSGTVQGMGRGVRILNKGSERFAQEKVHAWFIEPTLTEETLASVPEPNRRKYLREGTIYQRWLESNLTRIQEYNEFTSRSSAPSAADEKESSVKGLLQNLAESQTALAKERAAYKLLRDAKLENYFERYRTPVKHAWRTNHLARFLSTHLDTLEKDPAQLQVVLLPGPEALEIPVYLQKGIRPENIFAFEADPNPDVRNFCRREVLKYGCRFFEQKVEQVLPFIDTSFDIISIDTDGYLTEGLVTMFMKLRLSQRAVVLKNSLGQREHGEAKALLDSFSGDRVHFDIDLFKFISSQPNFDIQGASPHESLLKSQQIEDAALSLATPLARTLHHSPQKWTELLADLARRSPHLEAFEQIRYLSPKGRPFLSTFARLQQWDHKVLAASVSHTLRELLATHASSLSKNDPLTIDNRKEHLLFSHQQQNSSTYVPLADLHQLYRYWCEAVSPDLYSATLRDTKPQWLEVG